MRILIAVASKHGSTREIAEAVAAELRTQSFSVDVKEAGAVTALTGYDALILGSAIYTGAWLPEAKNMAERFGTELSNLPVWLFSSGPLGNDHPQPQDDPAKLAAPIGAVRARDHRVFVGRLDLDTLGFAERMLAKAVRAQVGDFRDWEAIRAWARGIGGELLKARTVAAR